MQSFTYDVHDKLTSGTAGNGTSGGSQVDALIGNLGRLVSPALEKLTGQSAGGQDQTDAIARALAANPAALQAIADALTVAVPPVEVKSVVPVVPAKREGVDFTH